MDVDHLCRVFSVTLAYTICNYLLTYLVDESVTPAWLLFTYIHTFNYLCSSACTANGKKKNRGKCGVSVVSSHDWKLSQGTSTTIWSKFKRGGLERHNAAIMGGTEKVISVLSMICHKSTLL
jgi:hypothetical protein